LTEGVLSRGGGIVRKKRAYETDDASPDPLEQVLFSQFMATGRLSGRSQGKESVFFGHNPHGQSPVKEVFENNDVSRARCPIRRLFDKEDVPAVNPFVGKADIGIEAKGKIGRGPQKGAWNRNCCLRKLPGVLPDDQRNLSFGGRNSLFEEVLGGPGESNGACLPRLSCNVPLPDECFNVPQPSPAASARAHVEGEFHDGGGAVGMSNRCGNELQGFSLLFRERAHGRT